MQSTSLTDKTKAIFFTQILLHRYIAGAPGNGHSGDRTPSCLAQISSAQLHMLNTILNEGPLTTNDLARKLKVSAPSASAMANQLVKKDILRRRQSPKDLRQVTFELTSAARNEMTAAEKVVLGNLTSLMQNLKVETIDKWHEVLQEVRCQLQEL